MSWDQIWILLTGVPAIWLSQGSDAQRRYACLFGMAGQPAWIVASLLAAQWGIFVLTLLYTIGWGRGIWRYWIAPWLERRRRPSTPCIHQDWVANERRTDAYCLVCKQLHPDPKNWLEFGSYSPHSTFPKPSIWPDSMVRSPRQ
jgi:hypothetical protein